MTEYHKIQSIFKRDMTSKRKTLIVNAAIGSLRNALDARETK